MKSSCLTVTLRNMTSKQAPAAALVSRSFRSAGERYFASAIPGLFNLSVSFLRIKDFVRFQEVYQSNIRCREHWPQLAQYVHRTDPNLFRNFESKAALRWAMFHKVDARGWELRLKGFSHNYSFAQVCHDGDLDLVRAMVERTQVGINHGSAYGRTPLHLAAFNGHLLVVQYLCQRGADKEAREAIGRTPLHLAAFNGHFLIVQYFCQQGADQGTRDKYGRTLLHEAASEGYLPVVKYLCEQGADKNLRDIKGRTPLHWARLSCVQKYLSGRRR
jgi:hypothetical protein